MNKLRKTMLIVLSVIILLLAIGWVLLWTYAEQNEVPDGVTAGIADIGGLSVDDAVAWLEGYEQALGERSITIEAGGLSGGSKSWTVEELGYKSSFAEAKSSLERLQEGSVLRRALYRVRFPKSFSLAQSWNGDALEAALHKQWGWIEKNESSDAVRTITEQDEVVYMPHTNAFRLDTGALLPKVVEWVILKPERAGAALRKEDLLWKAQLPVRVVQPKITLEKLKSEGIERKIVSFTTDFATSASGRAHNVTVTAESLHDWFLKPGEVFSYSELIAKAEKEHQYKEAPVIINGKFVPGIGGGICQVSSTLYQTVLRAGLDIVERRNHSLPVSYLPLGFDATYATDSIDFKFRNSTGKAMLIRTEVRDRRLTVKLFGTMPQNERYEIESVTLKTIPQAVKQTVNPSLSVGARKVVEQGKKGYVVETYRTLVRDGAVVSRERVSKDTYRAQPTLIEIGPASLDATPVPSATPAPDDIIVEDGL
ncbi:VanW family protein [Paenibacillus sp. GCM10027627]|uniref:VanW family protein n=1 Tax=unclassified Paenibacillus TaxID=185978 RepID=UPI003630552E